MPRLILSDRGNGHRPSSPNYRPSRLDTPGEGFHVVVLDVADKTHDLVGDAHNDAIAALEADPTDPSPLLLGHVVQVDNQRPVDSDIPGPVTIHIGASTLHEAATEAIGCYEQLARDMPEWVASTDKQLAAVLAEHFTVDGYSTCKVIKLSEVVA